MDDQSLHKGHRERLKQEFMQHGIEHFSELRALELLLCFSRFQGDVNPLAHRLLNTFGSLAGVLDARPSDLEQVTGVGRNTTVLLKLIPSIAALYQLSRINGKKTFHNLDELRELLFPYFVGATKEKSYLACFDDKSRLLGVRLLGEGSPSSNMLGSRKIFAEALNLNASFVILAHNHPSGDELPSSEDSFATAFYQNSLRHAGLELYDHVIITDKTIVSLRATSSRLWLRDL